MGLFDKPQIDDSAKNSSRSARRLGDWLNEDVGFILRPEIPDKGCDFMCELLIDDGATGLKFPVQLKSIQTLQTVSNGEFISYPMLTSRLGYMLRHLPTTGIIVFYSVETETCYYDFTDVIYDRINNDKKSEDWVYQDKVNIHLPLNKKFTPEVLKEFYRLIIDRFSQAEKMQLANGNKFGLPAINLTGKFQYDFSNPEHLKKALKEFGFQLLISYDLTIVYNTLQQLSKAEIESDKELLLLAGITYGETGKYAESDLFIRKLIRKFSLTKEEHLMIEYADAKNKLQLGHLSPGEFTKVIEAQKSGSGDSRNNLIIRINVLRFKVVDIDGLLPVPAEIASELAAIYKAIDNSDLDEETKDLFTLWNGESESHLLTHQLSLDFLSYSTARAIGKEPPVEERVKLVQRFFKDQMTLFVKTDNIYKKAYAKDNKFLQGSALSLYTTNYVQKLLIFIGQDVQFPIDEKSLQKFYGFAFQAYQRFAEINMLKDAHYCLCNSLEILMAAKYYYQSAVDHDIKVLTENKNLLEAELMLAPYKLTIPEMIARQTAKESVEEMGTSLKEMSDEQLLVFGRILFKPFQLPEERFNNMMQELRALQLFYQRCTNGNIQFLIFNGSHPSEAYLHPVSFKLKNKLTGIESLSSNNMDALLTSWGF